jgi:polyketide cyclase/dehydrase/lipid transport protein
MATAELAIRFAARADTVWSMLTGPNMVKLLLDTYASKVDVEGDGPEAGATLVTTLRGGGVVRERVESLDNAERCMTYRVLDAGPLPYAHYRGEVRAEPSGPDGCVVSLQCTFIPVGMTEAAAREYWLDHNRRVMETLRDLVESR